MDSSPGEPTLLSAARNFIRKSAGKAVLVIAPLAAVTAANTAEAQAFFQGPVVNHGGTGFNTSGASGFFNSGAGAGGQLFGANITFTNQSLSGSVHAFLEFESSGGSGILNNIPVDYDFTISLDSGIISSLSWHLDMITGTAP